MKKKQVAGFQWDEGNREKCRKHGVDLATIEALFLRPMAVLPDEQHSGRKLIFRAIGKSAESRYIRPISARYMHQKEVAHYEKENPDLQNG